MFDSFADLTQGVGEVFQNGAEQAADVLDPTQLGDMASSATEGMAQGAEDAIGSAQDALNNLNPFG
jgi:hypothetical protein